MRIECPTCPNWQEERENECSAFLDVDMVRTDMRVVCLAHPNSELLPLVGDWTDRCVLHGVES